MEPSSSAARAASPLLPGLEPPTERRRSAQMVGEIVVTLGYASHEAVEKAAERSRASGRLLGQVLVEDGVISPRQLTRALAERFGLDYVDLEVFPVDVGVAALISPDAARRYESVPIHREQDGTLIVATAEPRNVLVIDDLALMTGAPIKPAVASREDIRALMDRLAPSGLERQAAHAAEEHSASAPERAVTALHAGADDPPVVRLVDSILTRAVQTGASDVHFDPGSTEMAVHLRVDGELRDRMTVPRRLAAGVVSRLKIVASLDIAERRSPQDGRATLSVDSREIDVRVVTLPVVAGEAAVVRILDPLAAPGRLQDLGMADSELERFGGALSRAQGGVLVTGPTGSGKTTTLYAALAHLNTGERTIITIEDPVEYRLDGIKQMHVNSRAGVTFASGLRAIVRADPDVIMVGEIRDRDTARIAIESALTGHLVLSTLHTRDAPSAVARLLEMEIEPFLVSSAIDCIVGQRLVRALCTDCRRPVTVPAEVMRDHGFAVDADVDCFEPGHCKRCSNSGYRGRTAIFEVLELDERLREMVLDRASPDELSAAATGMRRLIDDGLDRIRTGVTSCAEVARVVRSS